MSGARFAFAFAVALAVGAGCAEQTPDHGASDTVRSYFAAVTAGDCKALEPLSGGKVAKNLERLGCKGLLDGYKDMGLELFVVNSEVADGRDHSARIVSALMSVAGKAPREVLLRVERERGRWVLVSL